jgi:hypothetical protein
MGHPSIPPQQETEPLERSDRLWDALDQTDAAPTTWTAPAAPEPTVARPLLSGARRGIATALLAAGLLVVGGVAVVNAADPSPSPSATQPSGPGTSGQPANPNGTHKGNCPNMGGSGSGSGGSSAPTTPNASPDGSGL